MQFNSHLVDCFGQLALKEQFTPKNEHRFIRRDVDFRINRKSIWFSEKTAVKWGGTFSKVHLCAQKVHISLKNVHISFFWKGTTQVTDFLPFSIWFRIIE